MSELIVYKASAGSGKTFTLTVEYISRLVDNPIAYRHILAVTFTNKATAEMKERILSVLYGIACQDKNSKSYLEQIMIQTNRKEEEIRSTARKALHYIVHDYNHFKVETIDSFFQSVMRNLARELDLSPNLNIELDINKVLNDAVDQMFANLTSQSKEMVGILNYIEERINEDKKWKIADEVKEFGKNIFNESVMNYGDNWITEITPGRSRFYYLLRKKRQEIREEGKNLCDKFIDILNSNGIELSSLNRGTTVEGYFKNLSIGNLNEDIKKGTIIKCLENPENWIKKSEKNDILSNIVSSRFYPLLQQAENYREKNEVILNSIELTLQHLNKISLLSAIKEEIKKSNTDHNRFLLAETNNLLHRIIDDNDSSFVFEKIGTNIRNVMIDEFQDTSSMQWDNFKMLLIEGLSQGADSLIVGDVKQSIYRWRNGDWNILNRLHGKLNHFDIKEKSLTVNRRSETRIITFNNYIFSAAKKYLNDIYRTEQGTDCQELLDAYRDVEQQSPYDTERGYVKISFIGDDKNENIGYKENTCVQLGNEVKELLERKVNLNDIAILVRKKNSIAQIADYFKDELHIRIISSEAFRLDSSIAINMLTDALRVLMDSNDKVSLLSLSNNYENEVMHRHIGIDELSLDNAENHLDFFLLQLNELKILPLYELLEKLCNIFHLDQLEGQDIYLFSFFDAVMQYLQDSPSDIISFLAYWDETLCSQTVDGGKMDGIHIYTIHASKGLQFHTVLIPFCDWSLENETNNQLVWCQPNIKPYDELKIVPVNYGSKMLHSIYRSDFLKEQLQLWVDNLNLLYVAFTRAKKNLIVFGNNKKKNCVSEMLRNIFKTQLDDDSSTMEIGESMPSEISEEQTDNKNIFLQKPKRRFIKMQSYHHPIQFKQSNRSAEFIATTAKKETPFHYINRGKMLHYIFSMIDTLTDIDSVIDQLAFEGVIELKEGQEIRTFIHQAFDRPDIKAWYAPDWQSLNERSIIWNEQGNLMSRRPDRVIVKEEKAVVIDFKFGKSDKKYNDQVKTYMSLLRKIGYKQINGYLWYVTNNRIESVKESD